MTYSIPLPSDETNASTTDDSIPQSPTDPTTVGSGSAEVRHDTPAPSNDAADPAPTDEVSTDAGSAGSGLNRSGSSGNEGAVAFVAPSTAGAIPAAVIPDETTDDVSAGADDPLRVPHESEDDWEDQFVKDPEAAKEATRERMNEQFEREHEEREREAGDSDDPAPAASVDHDPEGRHAVVQQPVAEQPVADGATPPSAYQVGGVPVDGPRTTAP